MYKPNLRTEILSAMLTHVVPYTWEIYEMVARKYGMRPSDEMLEKVKGELTVLERSGLVKRTGLKRLGWAMPAVRLGEIRETVGSFDEIYLTEKRKTEASTVPVESTNNRVKSKPNKDLSDLVYLTFLS